MDLSVIIVSWNVKDKLRANLNALLNSSGDFNLEIIVIDNHSQDGSPAMLRQEFPQIKLMVIRLIGALRRLIIRELR